MNKIKNFLRFAGMELIIIVVGIILDQGSKALIVANIGLHDSVTVIPKFLEFYYTQNRKAAFSFDFGLEKLIGIEGVRIFFIVFTFLAIGFLGFLIFKKPQRGKLFRASLAAICAGAVGNLIDRLFRKFVVDFIRIEYFGYELFGHTSFAVFNVADCFVVVGTVLLLISVLFFEKFDDDKKEMLSDANNDGAISNG